jgi:hypothetical protein
MVSVKSVKFDGEGIYFFDSSIYIFESTSGYTLELAMIVSEVVMKKYAKEENFILEIELQDGRVINTIMHIQGFSGKLPQLNLYCDLDDIDEYQDFYLVTETEPVFPAIGEGMTLEEIRKYEMPNEKVNLKLTLPIDITEWLAKQKKSTIETIFKEAIYSYWKKE